MLSELVVDPLDGRLLHRDGGGSLGDLLLPRPRHSQGQRGTAALELGLGRTQLRLRVLEFVGRAGSTLRQSLEAIESAPGVVESRLEPGHEVRA